MSARCPLGYLFGISFSQSLKFASLQRFERENLYMLGFGWSSYYYLGKFDVLGSVDRLCHLIVAFHLFLAHLSRRLIGELIGYPRSGVHPSVRRPSVHNAQRSSSPKPLGR